jgi:hypothetical protein
VIKRIALICFCPIAALAAMLGSAHAQSAAAPAAQQQAETAPAVPDDVRLILMIRNAVLALNQANVTGNYSVLREMGTPAFQMTNSPVRLGEVFASLRSRKIDLSPVMLFNPKLASPPALQEGGVLRLTGIFPTTPEQVQFDLAFQHMGERWMLAGVAVNVAPPADGAQASAGPGGQATQTPQETAAARPGEAKPIRIDLSQPPAAPGKPAAPKKPAAKKPKPAAPKTVTAQAPAAAPAEQPAAAAEPPAEKPAAEKPAEKAADPVAGWNPFGR